MTDIRFVAKVGLVSVEFSWPRFLIMYNQNKPAVWPELEQRSGPNTYGLVPDTYNFINTNKQY